MVEQLQIIDENAMIELGAQLAKVVIPGTIIYLDGDLGAGKTTLVRGFLRALDHTGAVKSPTFTVVEPYYLDINKFYNYNELEGVLKPESDNSSVTDLVDKSLSSKGFSRTADNPLQQSVYHFDLYRLEDPEELEFMGIRDYLDGQAIAVVEWPEKGDGILPKADLLMKISHQAQGRKVELLPYSEHGIVMVSKLASNRLDSKPV